MTKFKIASNLSLPIDFVTSTQVILAQKGKGKCLAPETLVLRYDGAVVRADSLQVGDHLMGPDSRPRVIKSCGRGSGAMFEIVPVKGEPWRCNGAHVLTLKHTTTGEIVDIQLDDYLAKSATWRREHMSFMTGVDFAPAEGLPLSPYFLGLWFGDGTKVVGPNGIRVVNVTTIDKQVADECEAVARQFGLQVKLASKSGTAALVHRIVNEYGAGNPLLELMRSIVGVAVTVPPRYLTANREDRLAFLAGWMDSDGSLSCNCFDFVQKRRDWSDAVMFLARSLGMRATVAPKWVDGEVYWRVRISGDVDEIPTRLPHKRALPRRQRKDHQRTNQRVVPIGVGDYFGFTLDGDGRYLLGDFTVTHNSYTADVEAEEMLDATQQVVIIDPTDAHWGLRSSPDGRSTGYPIAVFGGDHGDIALEPDAGVMLAEAVVAERFSAIICTENLTTFLQRLSARQLIEKVGKLVMPSSNLYDSSER